MIYSEHVFLVVHVFLIVLDVVSLKSRSQHGWVLFLACRWPPSQEVFIGWRESFGVSSSSYKGTNPIPRAPPSTKPNSFPKTPLPNAITMGVRDSAMNEGRGIVQSRAPWLTWNSLLAFICIVILLFHLFPLRNTEQWVLCILQHSIIIMNHIMNKTAKAS